MTTRRTTAASARKTDGSFTDQHSILLGRYLAVTAHDKRSMTGFVAFLTDPPPEATDATE